MTKLNLLVAYGGQSTEHDVSIASARNIVAALDETKYTVTTCFISRQGRWFLQDGGAVTLSTETEAFPVLGGKAFVAQVNNQKIDVDVLFPVLHGKNGEDGSVQGLAQLVGVPFVGPSILSAAVTMDKDMTKRLLERAGIPVVPWKTWIVTDTEPTYEAISAELGTDVFVKPASAGSSVGVSHVTSSDSWSDVLHIAAKNSEMVLIEKKVHGREIEVAVLGNHQAIVSQPGEIIANDDFYSYDAKYSEQSTSQVVIPANLSAETTKQLKRYALDAYSIVEGVGMSRVDFFVTNDNEIFLNEINSIPGFTDISMYPKLFMEQGMTYSELLDKLITLAQEVRYN